MYEDAVAERGLTDVGARTAVHGEAIAGLRHDLHGTAGRAGLLGQQCREAGRVRGAHGDAWTQPVPGEVRRLLVGDDPAAFQGHDVVGGARRLFGVRRAEQDGATLVGVGTQGSVQPAGLVRGERAGGVVEHQGVGVRDQCAGQPEASVHAAGEGAEPFVAQACEVDRLQDLVGAPDRDAGRRAQHAHMTAPRARRVSRDVSQQYADLVRGVGDAVQGAPSEVGETATVLQFEHESERGRLARAGRSEQCGDAARPGLEGDVVDGGR